jgi:hypothetical protein
MRRSLRLTMWMTLALSAGALLWPRSQQVVVAASARTEPVGRLAPASEPNQRLWARALEPMRIEPAAGDPFAVNASQGPVAPPPTLVAAPPPAVEPAAVVAPPFAHRFFGRMTTPGGEEVIMLARGDVPVPVTAGMELDDGYVVQAIAPEAVRVVYPPLGTVIDLPLPPPPRVSR